MNMQNYSVIKNIFKYMHYFSYLYSYYKIRFIILLRASIRIFFNTNFLCKVFEVEDGAPRVSEKRGKNTLHETEWGICCSGEEK